MQRNHSCGPYRVDLFDEAGRALFLSLFLSFALSLCLFLALSLSRSLYLCLYVYINVCIDTCEYTHIRTHEYVYIYIYICTHTCIYTYMHIHIHIYICMYVYTNVYIADFWVFRASWSEALATSEVALPRALRPQKAPFQGNTKGLCRGHIGVVYGCPKALRPHHIWRFVGPKTIS